MLSAHVSCILMSNVAHFPFQLERVVTTKNSQNETRVERAIKNKCLINIFPRKLLTVSPVMPNICSAGSIKRYAVTCGIPTFRYQLKTDPDRRLTSDKRKYKAINYKKNENLRNKGADRSEFESLSGIAEKVVKLRNVQKSTNGGEDV